MSDYTVAIIGSFQKNYDDILKLIDYFKRNGLFVLSPKESKISSKLEGFVYFDSDSIDYSPEEIQMITLNKIINADLIYVYNKNGYVGKTTCYEIGFCFSRRKPIYFYEKPDDLPIPVFDDDQILKPDELVKRIGDKKPDFISTYALCTEGEKAFCQLFDLEKDIEAVKPKRIVICGSMAFFDEMIKIKQSLSSMGISAIVPKEESELVSNLNESQFMEFKRKVSRTYLKKIRDKNTIGVLIYNGEKNGIPNYIGANTLVELAMAFSWNRKIFIYNDIYTPLKDELQAWECICLNGNLGILESSLLNEGGMNDSANDLQITMFDI